MDFINHSNSIALIFLFDPSDPVILDKQYSTKVFNKAGVLLFELMAVHEVFLGMEGALVVLFCGSIRRIGTATDCETQKSDIGLVHSLFGKLSDLIMNRVL